MPVPVFLVLFGRSITLALLRYDVNGNGFLGVLNAFKSLDERVNIVSVPDENIVKTHCSEKVGFSLAVALAESLEVSVKSAVVLGNGHIVVVDDDNKVRVEFACRVKTLECFAAAQRAVADNSNNVALSAREVTSLCSTAGKAYRSGGVTDLEEVVLAFVRVRISRNIVIFFGVKISVLSAREHLVWVALVRNIEDHLVLGRVENIVESDSSLDHTEVRAEVSAVNTCSL